MIHESFNTSVLFIRGYECVLYTMIYVGDNKKTLYFTLDPMETIYEKSINLQI